MPQWDQKLSDEVTQAIPQQEIDTRELDSNIFSASDSLEELLIRFVVILHDRSILASSNQRMQELLKRYIVAVVAVSCIEHEKLDDTLKLNLALPNLPTEGIRELVRSVDDVCDFYSYVGHDSTTMTQIKRVRGNLAGRFVRDDFPIVFDDDDQG